MPITVAPSSAYPRFPRRSARLLGRKTRLPRMVTFFERSVDDLENWHPDRNTASKEMHEQALRFQPDR